MSQLKLQRSSKHKKIDLNFLKIISDIKSILEYKKLKKHLMIRVEKWLVKLCDDRQTNNR